MTGSKLGKFSLTNSPRLGSADVRFGSKADELTMMVCCLLYPRKQILVCVDCWSAKRPHLKRRSAAWTNTNSKLTSYSKPPCIVTPCWDHATYVQPSN